MRIAVDAMGGDRAPDVVVRGALQAAREVDELSLVGPEDRLRPLLDGAPPSVRLVPSGGAIEMCERPVAALKRRPDASIRVAVGMAARGEADVVLSAGHTGALVAAASLLLSPIKGVRRLAVAVNVPTLEDKTRTCTLIDVGATVSCRAAHLFQFAVMGGAYARALKGVESPRIGLLNMGQESGKGTKAVQKADKMLRGSALDYVGFIEGESLFGGGVDVAVCEGFLGNVLLKGAEGLLEGTHRFLSAQAQANGAGAAFALALDRFRRLTDYAEYGGAPLLGTRTPCIICHGKSDERAIASALRAAARLAGLQEAIRADLERHRAGRFMR